MARKFSPVKVAAFVRLVGYGSLFVAGLAQSLGYTDTGALLMSLGAALGVTRPHTVE